MKSSRRYLGRAYARVILGAVILTMTAVTGFKSTISATVMVMRR
jgi:hypothetical protein